MIKLTRNTGFFLALMFVTSSFLSSCKDNQSEKKENVLSETSSNFSPKDIELVVYLYQFSNFDSKALQIWTEKSEDENLKSYAEEQLKITNKNKAQIEAIAADNGIKLPTEPFPEYERELYKYSTGGRGEYDKVFMQNYLTVCENFNDSVNKIILNQPSEEIKQLSQKSFSDISTRILEMIEMNRDWMENE
ncbi:MAG TPA: DUF4142 domain-containing protein [Flavobacterium sp.]|nr:DUF4142 domain-containing protein [Flavobacterium sp.]